MKNPFGKTVDVNHPYAIYMGQGPFGDTEVRVLKTYQLPHKEKDNRFARWLVAVSSDFTNGSFDYGDSYIGDAIWGLQLVQATPEWNEVYGPGYNPPMPDPYMGN